MESMQKITTCIQGTSFYGHEWILVSLTETMGERRALNIMQKEGYAPVVIWRVKQ